MTIYLSHFTNTAGEHVWQVLAGASPLCAETDEATAREIADDACSRHSVSTFVVWDGDRQKAESISHLDGKRGRR